jgi:hypothetical protein
MIVGGKGDGQGLESEGMGNSDDRRIATSPPAPIGVKRANGGTRWPFVIPRAQMFPLSLREGPGGEGDACCEPGAEVTKVL